MVGSLTGVDRTILIQLMLGKHVNELPPLVGVRGFVLSSLISELKQKLGARTLQQLVALALLEDCIGRDEPLIRNMMSDLHRKRLATARTR